MASGNEEKDTSSGDPRIHEKAVSASRPFSERFGFGYFRDTLDWFTGKGKKKEKSDGSGDATSTPTDDHSKLYLNRAYTHRSIKNTQLRQIIPLPTEIELQEWLSSQIIPFFHHINLLYGTVSEFCTQSACPVMSAPNITYFWVDDKGRKSKCSAVQYIDYVTASIEKMVKDDAVFPAKHGLPFPPNFDVVIRRIQRQLFHVLAHMYHAHFDAHAQLGTHVFLNGLFVHFVLFSQHFNLIEPRELDVLRDLIDCLLADTETIPEAEASLPLPETSSPSPVCSKENVEELRAENVAVERDNSKPICDKKPVSPFRNVDPTPPLNVKNLLLGTPLEGSVV